MVPPIVKMENIHKWFGKVHALRGVDFNVNQSEIVGLVGDNGAGKSTLIKILTGVFPPSEGTIFLRGKKVKFSSPKEARNNRIETVYQEQALVDDLSVARNLFMGKELQKSIGFIKILDLEKMKKESEKMLEQLGLHVSSMDQETKFCSGGEKQGIAIARAISFKADLVILDEPTIALGARGVQQVLNHVKVLKKRGIACIFITHNLYHVFPVADRFVIFSQGQKIGDILKKDTSVNKLTKFMIRRR